MTNLSFNERINIIVEAFKNNDIAKYVIPGIMVLGLILLLLSKSKKKLGKILTIILSLGVIGTGIYFFSNPIMSFLDYLVEVVVNNILFPNLAVYISTILIIDFVLILSILSNKMSTFSKIINVFTFTLMQVLLFFIVQNVIINNINVYEVLSIYTNQELLVLVEANMLIFAAWLILQLIVKIVRAIPIKEKEVESTSFNNNVVIDFNEIEENFDELQEFVPIKKKRV